MGSVQFGPACLNQMQKTKKSERASMRVKAIINVKSKCSTKAKATPRRNNTTCLCILIYTVCPRGMWAMFGDIIASAAARFASAFAAASVWLLLTISGSGKESAEFFDGFNYDLG